MGRKRKYTKKKRQSPKAKKKKTVVRQCANTSNPFELQMRAMGKYLLKVFKDKDAIKTALREHIEIVEGYFRKYDSVQLLGGIGLYLLDNLPNIEKHFVAQINGTDMRLDENAEVIAEYAMNFGLALPNDGKDTPTDKVIKDLRDRLKTLLVAYLFLDMPLGDEATQFVDWMIHMDTIAVRGDGYQIHVYEVFKEIFYPHTPFYQQQFGYSIEQLFDFFMDLENRVICKIGDQNNIYGFSKMYDRWKKWDEKTFGTVVDKFGLKNGNFSRDLFGEFFEANPDVPHTEDGMFLVYQPDDYTGSDMIFWVYPQDEVEAKILDSLSMKFGDNSAFLVESEFKGSIMNGQSIFEKPFVKVGDKYYCFTPMIPHRNMFLIAEKLMMRNEAYYQKNFQQNTNPISRDVYIESKVKSVMESFLSNVTFYSSVHYNIIEEDGQKKKPELDILGISDKAIYIIEVKAHELSYKDRIGLKGAKDKFRASVVEACKQCCRTVDYIYNSAKLEFGTIDGSVVIDKKKPIYKIAVTFQYFSSLLGQMDKLVTAGLMEERFRNTWAVSLFDLMVVADFIESEDEFLSYLDMRKIINTNHSTFHDELDLLGQFLNENLANKVKPNKPMTIIGGSDDIDEEYAKDFYLPMNIQG